MRYSGTFLTCAIISGLIFVVSTIRTIVYAIKTQNANSAVEGYFEYRDKRNVSIFLAIVFLVLFLLCLWGLV